MVQVRELQLDDYPAIAALNERNGLRTAPEPQWRRLWIDNPHAELLSDVPKGWVLEGTRGEIVGAACNVPMLYDLAGRALRSATGMAWAVDESHRNTSLLLLDAFFSQNRVELLLNTTANPVAGKAWQAFKAERLPHPDYDQNLLWITQYQRFARAATARLGWRGAHLFQLPVAGCLAAQDLWQQFRSRHGGAACPPHTLQRFESFDSRFDRFWQQLRSSGDGKLRAARDARSLEWHFRPALERGDLFILGCLGGDGSQLDGYLIGRRNDRADIRLRRFQVADLQVRANRAGVVPQLIAGALQVARQEKAAVVELTGFEPVKHRLAATIPHRVRRLATWPYFFKSRDPQLQDQLRNPDVWDPSPFDGDATL